MPVITFMSDFGTEDHYVAAVKGKLLSKAPDQQIIDISHHIKPFDISHGATVLAGVFRDFPQGTIHLVAVDSIRKSPKGILMELEGHYFIGFDCGLLSMISQQKPDFMTSLEVSNSTFPARDIFPTIISRMIQGEAPAAFGKKIDQMETLFARQLKATKKEIVGNVVNVDYFGNLITNSPKQDFYKILELNGAGTNYVIRFGRESFESLHHYFTDVESGDCYVFFNSIGFLQIGINKGNASQLLGLGIDAPVHVEFQTT
ncbi:MAG: SAM-dependent chlorinase/fluorinase [Bacteroidota bacterium]